MRDRASIILFLALILILVILAQNGSLGNLFASFGSTGALVTTNGTPLPTVRPLFFSSPVPTLAIAAPLPTAGILPTYQSYAPGQEPTAIPNTVSGVAGSPVPVGIVSSSGQCIVPNGWTAYTIQQGETLAVIANAYNLTVDQLAAANCLSNPDLIFEGQVLAVPPA